MNIKKMTALGAVVSTIVVGAVIGLAAPASAHTPSVSATCSTLSVNLENYAESISAKDEVSHVVSHHDLVSAEVPAVPAVTHTEYLYKQIITGHEKWLDSLTWNPGLGWYYSGTSNVIVDTPAQDAVPAVYKDWDETIIDSPAQEAEANHITVTVDGAVVEDSDFSSSFQQDFPLGDQYIAHTWHVSVTAWDNSEYNLDQVGETTACDLPVVDAVPGATIAHECGSADITLTNVAAFETVNKTASYVIYVDGKFNDAVSVASGETATRHLDFAEDTGDHHVVVRTGPAFGDKLVAEETVGSDCEENTTPPTEGGGETTPPVENPQPSDNPAPEAAPVAVQKIADSGADDANGLADTGSNYSEALLYAAGSILMGAIVLMALGLGTRKARRQ